MLVGQFDEDIFKRGRERADFRDDNTLFKQLLAEMIEVEIIVDEGVVKAAPGRGRLIRRKLHSEL